MEIILPEPCTLQQGGHERWRTDRQTDVQGASIIRRPQLCRGGMIRKTSRLPNSQSVKFQSCRKIINANLATLRLCAYQVSSYIETALRIWRALQWRQNERDGVLNHRLLACLPNRFFQAQIKENIKAPRHRPLWGEFTGDRWIPLTNGQ